MPPRYYSDRSANLRPSQRLPWFLKFPIAYAFAGVVLLGGLAVVGVERVGLGDWLLAPPATIAPISAQFSLCGSGKRVTCVVDGDTFWLEGEKYRIADFNAPEVSSPSCDHEARLGREASARLITLLSEAPFVLGDYERDADQYGRKLRIVERDGRSIAETMIAEGLAHPWRGKRESWC